MDTASVGYLCEVIRRLATAQRVPSTFAKDFVSRYRSDFRRSGASEGEAERIIAENVPRFQPLFDEVQMRSHGSIWLKQFSWGSEEVWWSVLDGRSQPAGRLRLSEGTRVRHIDRDFMWVIELDVKYLVRYRILRYRGVFRCGSASRHRTEATVSPLATS